MICLSCLSHQLKLDLIGSAIVKCRHDCASNTVPKPCSKRKVTGWNESVKPQKIKADLWYKIRHDAGCPASGVLFEIKKRAKSCYKYAVRRTLRQQNRLRSERMAHALIDNHGHDFWSEIRRINSKPTSVPPSVDSTTGNKPIADHWASLFESVLIIDNKNARDTLSTHLSQATMSDLRDIVIIPDVIRDSIAHLKWSATTSNRAVWG